MTTLELNWDRNAQEPLAAFFAPEFALAETLDLDRPDHAPTIRESNSALLQRLRELEDKVAAQKHARAAAPQEPEVREPALRSNQLSAIQFEAMPEPSSPPARTNTVSFELAVLIVGSSALAGAVAGIAAFFI